MTEIFYLWAKQSVDRKYLTALEDQAILWKIWSTVYFSSAVLDLKRERRRTEIV